MVSRLCSSSNPQTVATALLELQPFPILYIADLDAIQGLGHHFASILQLRARFPHTDIWLDAGVKTPEQLQQISSLGVTAVIGSESIGSLRNYRALRRIAPDHVLSLDFNVSALMGPAALLERSSLWPQRVICMTLAKVGSHAGPDIARLAAMMRSTPQQQIYAAGGVRDRGDLDHLAAMGVAGALVASALHDAALSFSND